MRFYEITSFILPLTLLDFVLQDLEVFLNNLVIISFINQIDSYKYHQSCKKVSATGRMIKSELHKFGLSFHINGKLLYSMSYKSL